MIDIYLSFLGFNHLMKKINSNPFFFNIYNVKGNLSAKFHRGVDYMIESSLVIICVDWLISLLALLFIQISFINVVVKQFVIWWLYYQVFKLNRFLILLLFSCNFLCFIIHSWPGRVIIQHTCLTSSGDHWRWFTKNYITIVIH